MSAFVRVSNFVSSVEQVRQVLLHRVRNVQSQSLDSVSRIHRGSGDEDTTVDDEQVTNVVASPPLVDDRRTGIGAHSRCSHQVPAGWAMWRITDSLLSAGRLEHLAAACKRMMQHLLTVLAESVVDLRCRYAIRIDQLRIDCDRVANLRQILADGNHSRSAVVK